MYKRSLRLETRKSEDGEYQVYGATKIINISRFEVQLKLQGPPGALVCGGYVDTKIDFHSTCGDVRGITVDLGEVQSERNH